jgi:hypothetical protein
MLALLVSSLTSHTMYQHSNQNNLSSSLTHTTSRTQLSTCELVALQHISQSSTVPVARFNPTPSLPLLGGCL